MRVRRCRARERSSQSDRFVQETVQSRQSNGFAAPKVQQRLESYTWLIVEMGTVGKGIFRGPRQKRIYTRGVDKPLLLALLLDPLNLEQDEIVVLALHDARVLAQRGRVVSAVGRLALLLLLVLRARLVRRHEERRQGRGELVDLLWLGLRCTMFSVRTLLRISLSAQPSCAAEAEYARKKEQLTLITAPKYAAGRPYRSTLST
jgi:hypothetical protein